jgi:hypothetical protein
MGLTDLRSRLTIIPRMYSVFCYGKDLMGHLATEDPTILSGTLRSTLDIFEEYEDAEIVRLLSPYFSLH